MYKYIRNQISSLYNLKAPSIGIGIFRSLYGLLTLQETLFLLHFNHLIFDPIPYIDVEYPMIPFFLCLWAINSFFIFIGLHCQTAIIINYVFWIIFVQFTPLQRDFDGGFDSFMIGAGFFLIFMPINKSFCIDQLRIKLNNPFFHLYSNPPKYIPALSYYVPILFCLGFLYFDSAIHKLFAEHWRNGLGAWLPSTQPYYISPIDFSWLLNQEYLQKFIGYLIIVFQFTFVFFFFNHRLQPLYLVVGTALHLGITLSLNIYPFGIGMLIFYVLMIPFSWWELIQKKINSKPPKLIVFYDKHCPFCNKTVLILNHFDILNNILFLNAQDYARDYQQLSTFSLDDLLVDLYAIDNDRIYKGIDTYIHILYKMRYLFIFGLFLKIPGVYHLAQNKYRKIAENRLRTPCNSECQKPSPIKLPSLFDTILDDSNSPSQHNKLTKITKVLILIFILQVNSTIHYGLLYRLDIDLKSSTIGTLFNQTSNSLIMLSQTFLGIIPHALYLHDHFAGYDKIFAITYVDMKGSEHWLPFVTQEGRISNPHWGRVHSMWANIAVTPRINYQRLNKFLMKITAFWAPKLGLSLENSTFIIKAKPNTSSNHWIYDLRKKNLTGAWTNAGIIIWKNYVFSSNLPSSN